MMKAPLFRCDIGERELKLLKEGYFAHVDYRRQYGKRSA